jgi:hypothetical protein
MTKIVRSIIQKCQRKFAVAVYDAIVGGGEAQEKEPPDSGKLCGY